MSAKALNIVFASAAGGGTGTLIALWIGTDLWFIGLLIGSLIGYLVYQVPETVAGVKSSWKATRAKKNRLTKWQVIHNRKLRKMKWGLVPLAAAISFAFVFYCAVFVAFPGYLSGREYGESALFGGIITMVFFGIVMTPIIWHSFLEHANTGREVRAVGAGFRGFLQKLNPLIIILCAVKVILRNVLAFFKSLPKFLRLVFSYIHSEARLACVQNAFVATLFGYFSGSIVLGIMTGIILGCLSYLVVTQMEPKGQ